MPVDPQLENYLSALERALKPLPVSERADIVTEMKSHVLSALDRDPSQGLSSVLSALGTPEVVANRYLIERGKAPVKPPISPIVKWLVVGCLGTFALFLIFVGALVWKFHPLLQVDEKNDHVKMFGGLIDIDGKKNLSVARYNFGDGWAKKFVGKADLPADGKLVIQFSNGNLSFDSAEGNSIDWDCKASGNAATPEWTKSDAGFKFDLSGFSGVNCKLSIPKSAHLKLTGANGKIALDEPHFELDADLSNGQVTIDPDEDQAYHYALSVGNGNVDNFVSSDKSDALALKVRLQNGSIRHE